MNDPIYPDQQDLIIQLVDIQDGNDKEEKVKMKEVEIFDYDGFPIDTEVKEVEVKTYDYYILAFGITEHGKRVALKIKSNIKDNCKIYPYFFIKYPYKTTKKFKEALKKNEYINMTLLKGPTPKDSKNKRIYEKKLTVLTKYIEKHNIDFKKFNSQNYFNKDSEINSYGKQYPVFVDDKKNIIIKDKKNNFKLIGKIQNEKFIGNGKAFQKRNLNNDEIDEIYTEIVEYESFDGYKEGNKKEKFLKITCTSRSIFSRLRSVLKHNYQLYESDIPPILRLFHEKNIKPASWIKISAGDYVDVEDEEMEKITKCNDEFLVNFQNIQPIQKDKIAPMTIASFDIECTSGDGGFPQPSNPQDKIIQIGTTIHKYGIDETEYRRNVIITLDTCDKIEGSEVIECKTEKEVIKKWCDLILEVDPDFITGYNIFGFDFEYLYERSCRQNCWGKNNQYNPLLNISRLEKPSKYDTKKLQSSALGVNILKFIKMPGRIVFDVMKYVQREFKLQSYKLDSVAQKYLKGMKKDDVSPNDIFRFQKIDSKHRAIVAKYCIQDCWLCNKLTMKFCIIENTVGMANTCLVPMDYIFSRGQGIKAQSLIANECRKYGYLMPTLENGREGTYKGAIVLDANAGYHFYPVSCLDYGSLYPSCMISHNLCISSLVAPHTNMELYEELEDCYISGVEYGDKHRYFSDDVRKDYFVYHNNETYRVIEWDNDPGVVPAHERYYYHQPEYRGTEKEKYRAVRDEDRAVLPKVLQNLLNQRKATKKLMKKEQDPFKKSILDGLQLSYKITANSVYGQLGSSTSAFSMPCVSASVTAVGRQLLELARDESIRKIPGTKPVYGDTDSVFLAFPLPNGVEPMSKEALKYSIDTGLEMEKYLDQFLTYPHVLEYEKTYQPFILFSKKRYVGKMYEFDHIKMKKLDYKGIELKRRDNADIVKKVYRGCLDNLLDGDKDLSLDFLTNTLHDINHNHEKKVFDIQNFVLTKTLKTIGSYKTKCKNDKCKVNTPYSKKNCYECGADLKEPSQGHVILAKRKNEINPGTFLSNERIPYVFISTKLDRKKVLQADRIETPDYIKENNIPIDYGYYIDQLENSILQLYGKQKDKKGKEIELPEGEVKEYLGKAKKIINSAKIEAENMRTGAQAITKFFKKKSNNKNNIKIKAKVKVKKETKTKNIGSFFKKKT